MRPIHFVAVALFATLAFPLEAAVDNAATPKPSFAQPAISPDGSRVAFVSGGAIWEVPSNGGAAHLMVADKGADSRPLFSPDGNKLAFVSDATGDGDIYVLDIATGALTRLTYADGRDELSGWSHDGQWIYFSSAHDNAGGFNAFSVFRVNAVAIKVFEIFRRSRDPGLNQEALILCDPQFAFGAEHFDRQRVKEFVGENDCGDAGG